MNGYAGAEHKSFGTRQEAEEYMNATGISASTSKPATSQSSRKRPLPSPVPVKVTRPFFVKTEVCLVHVRIIKTDFSKAK